MTDAQNQTPQSHEFLGLYGISHRTAPVPVLERLALSNQELNDFYGELAHSASIADALVLSTCNRTEVYTLCESATNAEVSRALQAVTSGARLPSSEHTYQHRGRSSVEHLFRVACGLDSMVIGEAQILGQVKEAFEISRQHRQPTPYFSQVLGAAFKAGRRCRAETEIGRGAVSIASAAVHLGSRIYADLSRRTVVVVGAGSTGKLAAEHFATQHPRRLIVVNRTKSRADDVADAVGADVEDWSALEDAIAAADIVVCAVKISEPVVPHDMVERAMRRRSGQPLALIDLGLPRNVDHHVNRLANVFVHDLDALKQIVDVNLARRRREVPRVEGLIQSELDRLLHKRAHLEAGPLIASLRGAVERARAAEVEKATSKLSANERQAVERATRAVIAKLLHGPTTAIKDFARAQKEGTDRLELIKRMFGNLQDDD